ncbi:hypothetical protein P7B04_15415 [Sphingobium yanoikuyae]|uniref:hypothetical protein n=1 Tax=Sphingobium yanoikuyae TaxID=13690 RepID=UPI0012F86544|nr:hypothetical protein [Sphingobium yanoikuyae]MDG2514085.1 hypothetical protein [Sphingobium yanoikuyae]
MKFRVMIEGRLSAFGVTHLPECLVAGASIFFPSRHQQVIVDRVDRDQGLIYARLPA